MLADYKHACARSAAVRGTMNIGLVMMLLSLVLIGCNSPNNEASRPVKAVACWERMRNTGRGDAHELELKASRSISDLADARQDLIRHWQVVLNESSDIFFEYIRPDASDEGIRYLVRRFGKDGAEADARLLFGPFPMLCPPGMNAEKQNEEFAPGMTIRQWRGVVTAVKREQVIMFLEDKELLKRYYRAALWWGVTVWPNIFFHLQDTAEVTARGFAAADQDSYWDSAWTFALLACATDRTDLLEGVEANQLGSRFNTWHKWLLEQDEAMSFDVGDLVWRPTGDWRFWRDGASSRRSEWLISGFQMGMLPARPFDDWNGPPLVPEIREQR